MHKIFDFNTLKVRLSDHVQYSDGQGQSSAPAQTDRAHWQLTQPGIDPTSPRTRPAVCGLQTFLARPDFSFTFDGLHGVSGPYAKRIFGKVWFAAKRLSDSLCPGCTKWAFANVQCQLFDDMRAGVGCSRGRAHELRPPGGVVIGSKLSVCGRCEAKIWSATCVMSDERLIKSRVSLMFV